MCKIASKTSSNLFFYFKSIIIIDVLQTKEEEEEETIITERMNSFLLYALCFAIAIMIVHFKFNLTPPLFGSLLVGFWIIKMKFHRRFGIGITCFKNPKPNLKAETEVDGKPLEVPPHLVVMVNGIVGR